VWGFVWETGLAASVWVAFLAREGAMVSRNFANIFFSMTGVGTIHRRGNRRLCNPGYTKPAVALNSSDANFA
jgi:hypothetical protein